MDIIAAHRQGLIEQLEEEVVALAGRPRDHGQRAVVLHHLFNHSRGVHVWALVEARRGLRIQQGIEQLRRRLRRWGWAMPRREEAGEALGRLAEALGEASRQRCAFAYRAYRLSATSALREEAERTLAQELLAALDGCHAARREGEEIGEEARANLARLSEQAAAEAVDRAMLAAAWDAVGTTGLKRAANALLGEPALGRTAARDRKKGPARLERRLRQDATLPAPFRANPAQHFYALQHALAERRRQQWRDACDREPDAIELAA